MKILSIFGTRPEAIKMAPLVNALQQDSFFESKVAVTGQHRKMLDQVLDLFEIKADYDLNIMKKDQDLFSITSDILSGIKPILSDFLPDLVLVHGDTSTTFAASLASFYMKIPVAHVEAGLRTGDIYSPWPEECNRQLTSRIAKLHFCPTVNNKEFLLKEGVDDKNLYVTGNTVIDSLLWVLEKIERSEKIKNNIKLELIKSGLNIEKLNSKIILITGHRRENFGLGFENICTALRQIALEHKNIEFVYPVHLNPNVQEPVKRILSNIKNIHLIDPVGYEAFAFLMKKSHIIITDSGGIQEEAPSLGKPVLVIRETTERPEAVKAGTVKLIGTEPSSIINNFNQLINNVDVYTGMAQSINPYGNGTAVKNIITAIKNHV